MNLCLQERLAYMLAGRPFDKPDDNRIPHKKPTANKHRNHATNLRANNIPIVVNANGAY